MTIAQRIGHVAASAETATHAEEVSSTTFPAGRYTRPPRRQARLLR